MQDAHRADGSVNLPVWLASRYYANLPPPSGRRGDFARVNLADWNKLDAATANLPPPAGRRVISPGST